MAEEFEIIKANLLPVAGTITDNDMILIIQGGRAKRALPSAMKGKQGDPGLSAFLGINDKYILWKQGANGLWNNLIEIEKLRGPKGEKPIFRKVNGTLQMKYEGEPDSAFVNIFDREELKMKFTDLTPAEVDLLKLHFADLTEADKAELMKPATDAAAEVRQEMVRISQEVSQVITDTNTAKTNAETATTNANTAATAANAAAGLATDAADDANTAAGIAVEAATLAGSKAEQASTAARNAITATEDAINATSGAVAATGLANAAATAANTAKDNADIATGNANIATDRANAAAQAAENIVLGIRPDYNVSDPTSGNYIANKPEIPTLAVVPGSDTLSYVNSSGTTINFRIGDEVRVLENGEYVFYKLYDLADGVASWQESGSGTALPGNIYLQGANYYNESVRIIKGGNLNE